MIALGAGVATPMIGLARRDTPAQALTVIGAAGSFAALAFIFTSPVIAAVILIEATGLGGPKLRVVLIPGLLAAGIGTLVSIGIGSFTGLSTSAYALGPIPLASLGPAAAVRMDNPSGDLDRGRDEDRDARRHVHPPVRVAHAAAFS